MLWYEHMSQHTFRVIIEPDGKRFHAFAPALPGCHTHGKTIKEAQKHIGEAIDLYVAALAEVGKAVPVDNSFEAFYTVESVAKSRAAKKRVYA